MNAWADLRRVMQVERVEGREMALQRWYRDWVEQLHGGYMIDDLTLMTVKDRAGLLSSMRNCVARDMANLIVKTPGMTSETENPAVPETPVSPPLMRGTQRVTVSTYVVRATPRSVAVQPTPSPVTDGEGVTKASEEREG